MGTGELEMTRWVLREAKIHSGPSVDHSSHQLWRPRPPGRHRLCVTLHLHIEAFAELPPIPTNEEKPLTRRARSPPTNPQIHLCWSRMLRAKGGPGSGGPRAHPPSLTTHRGVCEETHCHKP